MIQAHDPKKTEFLLGLLARIKTVGASWVSITLQFNVIIIFVSIMTSIFSARILGPSGRGELAAAVTWATMLWVLFGLGLTQSVSFFATTGEERRKALLWAMSWLSLALGLASLLVAFLLYYLWHIISFCTFCYCLGVPFVFFTTNVAAMFLGAGALSRFNLLRLFQAVGLPLGLFALLCLGQRHSALIVVKIAVAFDVTLSLVALWAAYRFVQDAPDKGQDPTPAALIGYGLRAYFGNLSQIANLRLDQLVLSLFAPLASLGIYAAMVSYSNLLFSLGGAFALSIYPRIAGLTLAEARPIVARTLFSMAALLIPLAVAMLLLAPRIVIWIFGPSYLAGVVLFYWLLPASLLLVVNYILSQTFRALGKPEIPSLGEFTGLAITVLMLPWAVRQFGLAGAAGVSFLSYLSTSAILGYALALRRLPATG